jgi:hypothetical protein
MLVMKFTHITVVVFLFIFLALPIFARGAEEAEVTGFTEGTVEYLEGEVTVNGSAADFGTVVKDGAVIETGPGSFCDIVFGEKNVFRFYEETLAVIDFSSGELDMQAGSMGAVLNKLANVVSEHGSKFQVASPQVVGGVRGTAFFVKVESEISTYLCACWGELDLDTRAGLTKGVESRHHKAFHFIQDGDTVRTVSGKLLYHDDDSMDDIADRINSRIQWEKKDGRKY